MKDATNVYQVNLIEILRDFEFDQTYTIIEWFRHCKMEHWSGSYCSFRYFSCGKKGLSVMGYFVAARVL